VSSAAPESNAAHFSNPYKSQFWAMSVWKKKIDGISTPHFPAAIGA
jgi:hypothetical protein